MVSSQQEEVFWVLDFVCQQEAHRCYAEVASVHVVAEEKVVGFRREQSAIKVIQQVLELAVDVAENVYWWDKLQQNGLLEEDLLRSRDELSYFFFFEDVRKVLGVTNFCLVDCVPRKFVVVH